MLEGRVENWLMVIDCMDVGVTEIPIQKLKGFMQAMLLRYRGRMFRTIAINSPWLVRGIWSLLMSWFDEYIQKKILINGFDYQARLLEYIDASELEEKDGGTQPNLECPNFFPINI